jgi:outer membrane protein insertion porin family/translocation and assembly module TamA
MATLVTQRVRSWWGAAVERWGFAPLVVVLAAAVLGGVGCTHVPPGRYAIDDVVIEGSAKVDSSDIEEKIATAESPHFLGLFRGVVLDYELFDPYILERDLQRIQRYYRSRGYYEAEARAGRVEKVDDQHVKVTVVVDEGPPVTVGDVKINGIASLSIDDTAAVLAAVRRRLRTGRNFDEGRYEEAQELVKTSLTDRGYAFAKVEGHVEVDLAKHVATVVLDVTPGRMARFGAVTVTGLGPLPEAPVRRALDLTEGEVYSTTKLVAAKRAVLMLGVFSDAEVAPDLERADSDVVPVRVVVTPSELRTVKLGGGIELDVVRAGVHGLTGWEDRNFLGGMRRFNVDLRPGIVLYPTRLPKLPPPTDVLLEARARAELRQPGVIEARTSGSVRAEINVYPVLLYSDNQDEPPPDSVLGYLDLTFGYGFDRSFGPIFASLSYNFQNSFPFTYGSSDQNGHNVVISYLDLKTTVDLRDDPVKPHGGLLLANDFQFAGLPVIDAFRADSALFAKDLRLQPELLGYVPITRRWTLALRATTGFLYPFPSSYGSTFQPGVEASTDDIQLVFFRGFFSGGPNSNRGYAYRGVGPQGSVEEFLPGLTGDYPTGGLTLWEASIEVRFPISGELGGTVFCDASDVSRYRFDLRLLYPHLSCGVGVQYGTPVGALGFAVGFPIPGAQSFDENAPERDKVAPNPFAVSIGIESR